MVAAVVRAQPPASTAKPHADVPAAEEDRRLRFSDVETASSTTAAHNSSLSSASSSLPRCSSLSFDSSPSTAAVAVPMPAAAVRPHRSGDAAWAAVRAAASEPLGPKDFKLVRRVGGGDIGTVYLCRLRSAAGKSSSPPPCLYAMKVVDRRVAAAKKKLERAEAEKRILRVLDHPFLPTLFADFDADPHFSCVVTEFCPGGDLHSLRHRMPERRFPLPSARFYAAEVLLALEYLHMMGIVYRDLKPENVLIRGDGHIMLTDFDLSLESTSSPLLDDEDTEPDAGATATASCFPYRLLLVLNRRRRCKQQQQRRRSSSAAPTFVAEPVDARSCSFVGTHEYVAPEVARGGPHGAAVDWWAYGVFLYELIHGRTPFAGADNESTLRNIVRRPLQFPPPPGSDDDDDAAARDLIAGLLAKDPAARLGSRRGAADVKAHPFFRGLNFALLRSTRPPFVPPGTAAPAVVHRSQSCKAARPGVPGAATVHRSRSCKAACPAAKKRHGKDARFDLFF